MCNIHVMEGIMNQLISTSDLMVDNWDVTLKIDPTLAHITVQKYLCRTKFQNFFGGGHHHHQGSPPPRTDEIVKPFKLATLLKFEQKREHFSKHIQKMEKVISWGWKVKRNDCISEVMKLSKIVFL